MVETLIARGWLSHDPDFDFPERSTDLESRTDPVGICISGGGTRSMCAGIGQLRGLHALGLLSRVRYLSCVSGGSWISAPFVFYSEGSGSDEAFLGPVTAPEELTLKGLRAEVPTDFVGWTATQEFNTTVVRKLKAGCTNDLLWVESVGEQYFQPWGLYDPTGQGVFTLNEDSREDILRRNPGLRAQTVHMARPNRPFLIVNGTVVGVEGLLPLAELNPSPFEVTPLYAGSPFGWEVLFRCVDRRWESHWLGGGFIEPLAVGCREVVHFDRPRGVVEVNAPTRRYQLCDASGMSSAFLAGFAERLPFGLVDLNPSMLIKPVNQPEAPARMFSMGDGGVLENFGLLTLMRRKVPRAIVFINTSVPLNLEYDASAKTPEAGDVDPYLPPLFGFHVSQVGVNTAANRVFRPRDFVGVMAALQAARRGGGPAVAKTTHEVQRNTWWGVESGWSIDVVWVYLDRCPLFEDAIVDSELRAELAKRDRGPKALQGSLLGFPQYSTACHNGVDLVKLLPEQVRLLADQTCWTILQSRALIESLFAQGASVIPASGGGPDLDQG